MNHPFRKKWGQNFLQDPNIIRNIVQLLDPKPDDIVLEIGSGKGALTFEIAQHVQTVHAIEIDPLLVNFLNKNAPGNVQVHKGDILDFDLAQFEPPLKVIGNLPYYITSPILFKFLEWQRWSIMVFMAQREVAQRITASPGNKIYGRLSVMAQALSIVELSINVPKTVFYPQPDVDSAVLKFKPGERKIDDFYFLSSLVKQSFSQRRKTLRNNLKGVLSVEQLGILAGLRAEALTVDQFIQLSHLK